jgi:hypothetical protein
MNINGTVKPSWYWGIGYQLEISGTRFFNPIDCHYSFILGQGSDKYKTCVGDKRYNQIEEWLVENIIPKIRIHSKKTRSSYTIKHWCEAAIGGYVSNETVKFILSLHRVPIAETKEDYPINIRYYMSLR